LENIKGCGDHLKNPDVDERIILKRVRFEVLTAVKMVIFFWAVVQCGLVGGHQRFGKTHCLQKNNIDNIKTDLSY
jgi:hypothetical protein